MTFIRRPDHVLRVNIYDKTGVLIGANYFSEGLVVFKVIDTSYHGLSFINHLQDYTKDLLLKDDQNLADGLALIDGYITRVMEIEVRYENKNLD